MNQVVARFGPLLQIVVLSLALTGFAQANTASINRRDSANNQADLVVVMKSQRELYLYRHGMMIGQYPISLGLSPIGDKHMSGDDKTPTGAYTLDWRNPNSHFYLSIHISYPNAQDLARAAALGVSAGNDIMIHGQPNGEQQPRSGDWTYGCIAVSDTQMNQIWDRVPDGTPIHIYP